MKNLTVLLFAFLFSFSAFAAFSSEKKSRSLAGNLIMEVHSFSAASVTSGSISTGIGTILHASLNNAVSEGQGLVTFSGQAVSISSLTSNDTGSVIVIGY
jgi:hypothetical protein